MTKIDKEAGIARVYQFLNTYSGNWKADADFNNDNTIIKNEFSTFLLGKSGFKWDGESAQDKADIIDAFWKSIDTEVTGRIGCGSRLSNKNALNKNELAQVQNNIYATDRVVRYMKSNNISAPGALANSNYSAKWKESVKNGVINRAITYLQENFPKEELTQEKVNEALSDSVLEELILQSSRKATADYTALLVIDKKLKGQVKGYAVGEEILNKLIDEYVNQVKDSDKSLETIMAEVEKLVDAYIDTKDTNSQGSIQTLLQYGYDQYGLLNPLQKQVLTNDMTDKIQKYLKENMSEYYTKDNEEQVNKLIAGFVENYLAGRTADEFLELKNFDPKSFTENTEFQALIQDIKDYQDKLANARNELNQYIAQVLALEDDEKTNAVNTIIGSTDAEKIQEILLGMKDLDTITAKHTELKNAIDAIDKQLPDNFLNALTDITISASETKTITLPNNYGSYTTGHIHYSATGDGALKVNDSGAVTIGSSTPGVYTATVTVKDDNGNVLKSKTIKITVEMSAQSVVNNVKGWDNQVSEHLEGVLPKEDDSCNITNKLTDTSFADLYNNDYIVRLHISMDDSESWESAQKIVNSRLDQLGNLIYSSLLTANLDTDILKSAVDSVIGGYKFTSTAQMDRSLNDDDDGTDGYDLTNNLAWRMKNDRNGTGHKVVGTRDDDGSDSWVWGVRFKDIVDDIIAKYKALGGN